MRVLVTPDYRTLSETAADLIAKTVRVDLRVTLGLPTGATPLGMYADLARRYHEERLDFSRTITFNLDEYEGLAPGDPHSFAAYMQENFYRRVNIPAGQTHIPAEGKDYERLIREAGGIDLLIMGIGANGHIAFNEPGSSFTSRTRSVNLAAETIDAARKYFGPDRVPSRAITMGIGTIMDSRRILLLASGAAKAKIVRRALRGPVSESVPASALQMHPNVIVLLDEDCGKEL